MNRGCGNIARTNLINRLLFYALYGDKIIASEGYMRVYSNHDDLGACSNNLLYTRSMLICASRLRVRRGAVKPAHKMVKNIAAFRETRHDLLPMLGWIWDSRSALVGSCGWRDSGIPPLSPRNLRYFCRIYGLCPSVVIPLQAMLSIRSGQQYQLPKLNCEDGGGDSEDLQPRQDENV